MRRLLAELVEYLNSHPDSSRLSLTMEDSRYTTYDWSATGCRVRNFHRPLKMHERLRGIIKTPMGRRGQFMAEVSRFGDDGSVHLRWIELPSRALMDILLTPRTAIMASPSATRRPRDETLA